MFCIFLRETEAQLICKHKGQPRRDHESQEWHFMYSSTVSVTSVLDRDGWLMLRLGHFTPGETRYLFYRLVGPRTVLGGCEVPCPHRDSISGPSSSQRVAVPTTLSQPTNWSVDLWVCRLCKKAFLPVFCWKKKHSVGHSLMIWKIHFSKPSCVFLLPLFLFLLLIIITLNSNYFRR